MKEQFRFFVVTENQHHVEFGFSRRQIWATWGAKDCNPYDGTRYLTFGNGNGIVSEQCSDSWEARTCSAANLLLSQARALSISFHPVAGLKVAEDGVYYELSEIVRRVSCYQIYYYLGVRIAMMLWFPVPWKAGLAGIRCPANSFKRPGAKRSDVFGQIPQLRIFMRFNFGMRAVNRDLECLGSSRVKRQKLSQGLRACSSKNWQVGLFDTTTYK